MRVDAVVIALILSVLPLSAQTPQGTQVIFPVRVNTVPRGEAPFVLSPDYSEAWLSARELERLGVRLPATVEIQDGWVNLAALSPLVEFMINEETLELELTVDPTLLGESQITANDNRPRNMIRGNNPSAFLNYAVSSFSGEFGGALEIGGTRGPHLIQSDLSLTPGGDLQRGLTQYRFSDLDRMIEWTVGDRALGTSLLGGRPVLGGVAVTRNFGLDPYFVRTPTLGLEGIAQTPSEVEVYVNGVIVRRERVQPGQIRLENLPVTGGSGEVRLVVRDAFGREVIQNVPYYMGTSTLREGLWEFQAGAGSLRTNFRELFEYEDAAVYGEARYGLTGFTTLEGRAEAGNDVVSADAGATFRTRFGQFRGVAGGSTFDGDFAPAFAASYNYNAHRFGVGVSAIFAAENYATLTSEPNDSDVTDFSLVASVPLPYVGLTVSARDHRESGNDRRSVGLSTTIPILDSASVTVTAASVRGALGDSYFEGGVALSWRLGSDTSIGVQARSSDEREIVGISVQKSLLQGPGLGYRLNWNAGDDENAGAAVQYQTNYGRYEVAFDPSDLERDPVLTATGGLVYIGDRLIPTRTTGQSFALVRVADLEGVTVFRSNQPVGETTRGGDLLIPDLLPYYANDLSIDHGDIPFEYRINGRSVLVAPPARGGVLVEFPIMRVQSVSGRIVIASGESESIPALGGISLQLPDGTLISSPIGRDGSFWFEDVPPGSHEVIVSFEGSECRMALQIPAAEEPIIDMGVVRCEP